jgi:phasin
MTTKPTLEVPPEVRSMNEKNLAQARVAYDQFMSLARQSQETLAKSSTAVSDGVREVQAKTLKYTEQNLDASFQFAAELAKAKSLQEIMEIQARFAQKQMLNYSHQAQDLGRSMADASKNLQTK